VPGKKQPHHYCLQQAQQKRKQPTKEDNPYNGKSYVSESLNFMIAFSLAVAAYRNECLRLPNSAALHQ
jgi:hypothetical protein